MGFGGVDIGGGNDFIDFVPGGAHKAAHAALGFVAIGMFGIFYYGAPGFDWVIKSLAHFSP